MNDNAKYYAPSTLDLPGYIVIFTPVELGVSFILFFICIVLNRPILGMFLVFLFLMMKRSFLTQERIPQLTVKLYQALPFQGNKLPPSFLKDFRGNYGF